MLFSSISSLQNPRIKNLIRLRDGHHRRRQQQFIVEGHRELERAFRRGWEMATVYFCPEFFKSEDEFALLEEYSRAEIELLQLSEACFRKAAYRENPDGWLAELPMRIQSLADIPLHSRPLILILAGVEKPGNIGAMMRSANAAGADAVILADGKTDFFSPHVVRASQGALFDLAFSSGNRDEIIDWLGEKQILPVLTTPDAGLNLWECDLSVPVAIVVGAEDEGLDDSWLSLPLIKARIPMKGVSDSLNVSTAAAIALFEAVRQREHR